MPASAQPNKLRTIVYIDGFNLYYAVRRSGCKWLDLLALAKNVLPPDLEVQAIKYFTARVSGSGDLDRPRRQQIYLNALRTLPGLEVYFGSFLSKNQIRPVVNLPIAGRNIRVGAGLVMPIGNYVVDPLPGMAKGHVLPVGQFQHRRKGEVQAPLPDAAMVEVFTKEEKGSDVNLAVQLVNDAWKNSFDAAAIMSADTDLVEPIRITVQERGKTVCVISPANARLPEPLRAVATFTRIINPHILKSSVFPDEITKANGTRIRKPVGW